MLLAGQAVARRIDAVYRLAWTEAHGLYPEEVDAVFHHLRSGRVVRPTDLPDRAGIEAVISGGAAAG